MTNQEIFEEACQYIPGGVNSPVRAFKSVGEIPVFAKKGDKAHLFGEVLGDHLFQGIIIQSFKMQLLKRVS